MQILSSATKIVFIMVAGTLCYGFIMGLISPGDFIQIATIVFMFYYTVNKAMDTTTITTPSNSKVDTSVTTTPIANVEKINDKDVV